VFVRVFRRMSSKSHTDIMRSSASLCQHSSANSVAISFVAIGTSSSANNRCHLARAFDFMTPYVQRSKDYQVP
jgi:hypothetical protein